MDKVNQEVVELIREAARQGAEVGYKAVYNDIRRNGSIRRALVYGGAPGALDQAGEERVQADIVSMITRGKITGSNRFELDFKTGEVRLGDADSETSIGRPDSPGQVLEKITAAISESDLASQVPVDSDQLSAKSQTDSGEKLSVDQGRVLGEKVVSEVFYSVLSAEEAPSADNGLTPLVLTVRRGLPPEELSRRIDAAIAMSVEKLRQINRYC